MATNVLTITPAALQDLQTGIDYYNSKTKGLGRRFEAVIHQHLVRIQAMPLASSFAYDTIRYKPVDAFPYIILYETAGSNVTVLRVFNTFLDPEYE